jgi:hexosaminidase
MKNLFLGCLFLGTITFLKPAYGQHSIIPEPVQYTAVKGSFSIPKQVNITAPATAELATAVKFLSQRLSLPTGSSVTYSPVTNSTIKLLLNNTTDQLIGNEGYQLSVKPTEIIIKANREAGLFYGIQTLLQLLPAAIESNELEKNIVWKIPCCEITDYPRFGWRGLMLDVSRHFYTKQEVKDFIDQMVRYKYNLFHWHLTDDEGWRIEIKSLPKLTTIGAWNVKKTGYFGDFSNPLPEEPKNYGGFYTQEDIKEVVQYGKDRFVNILPEVDVPGHSLAAIVSYPELSCTEGAASYQVRSGEKIMDWHSNGTFTALVDNSLCPANEKVYGFLDKVFTEVANLFPFGYIHVGGDECAKNFWEKSPEVLALMQKEGLKDSHEVQSYFEKRVEKIITSKGKKIIGWDEILEGGLAPNAAVMSWRGEKGGIEAAKLQHEVVMSPTTFTYLDFMQSDAVTEPKVYATLRLNTAYQFDPVPAGVDAKYIKGGQGNVWTEQIYNTRHLQYMVWPRAFALAESVWSPKEKKNWPSFVKRVEEQFKRYDIREIKYAPSMYDVIFSAKKDSDNKLQIELTTEIDGLDMYYSFDNSFPDQFYPKYTATLVPPKDAVMLKVITYRGKQAIGRMISMPIEEMKKRTGIK